MGRRERIASLFKSKAFQTTLLIAVLLVMAGLAFMASVTADLQAAAIAIAGLLTLIVVVDAFKAID